MARTQKQETDALLRKLLKSAIRLSSKSRQTICDELSIRLGRKISKNMLNKWTGENNQEWRLPAEYVPVLCEILDDDTMQRQLLSESLNRALQVGEWVLGSEWVLDMVSVKLKKRSQQFLRIGKRFAKGAEARR
jgi:hypothetical protein